MLFASFPAFVAGVGWVRCRPGRLRMDGAWLSLNKLEGGGECSASPAQMLSFFLVVISCFWMRGSWWWWWWWWWRSSKGTGYQGGACRAIFKTQTDGTNRQVQSKYRQVGVGSRQKQCIPTSQPFWPLGSKAYWAWTIEPLHGLPQKSASVVAVCLLRFSWFGVFGYVCFVFFLGFWLFHSNSQLFEFILTTPHPAKSNKQGPVAATRRRCRSHKQKKTAKQQKLQTQTQKQQKATKAKAGKATNMTKNEKERKQKNTLLCFFACLLLCLPLCRIPVFTYFKVYNTNMTRLLFWGQCSGM